MTLRRPSSIVKSLKQHKQRQRDQQRRFNRKLFTEQLEDRRLLAGPELIAIRPDEAALLQDGDTLHTAPREFNLLFEGGANIKASTIAGNVRLVRPGADGIFDDINTAALESTDDILVDLGYADLEDPSNPVQIAMRPASSSPHNPVRPEASFPDDRYQIQILGDRSLIGGSGVPLSSTDLAAPEFQQGTNFVREFRLDTGAQVVAVVPQPVSRNTFRLTRNAGATSGDFTLTFNGRTTLPINLGGNVKTNITNALVALRGVNPTDVVVVDRSISNPNMSDGPWDITFEGQFAGEQSPALTLGGSALNMGNLTVNRNAALTQARNQVVVYFDDQDLNVADATDPKFYRLINTKATLDDADDTMLLPQTVTYDTVDNSAVLIFANDLPEGTYRLDIGASDENNGTFTTAVNVGSLFSSLAYQETAYIGDTGGRSTDGTDDDFYRVRWWLVQR